MKIKLIAVCCLVLLVSMAEGQQVLPEETEDAKTTLSTTVDYGIEIDAPYNLTMRQLAAKTRSVLLGTAVAYDTLRTVGNPALTLLYGTVAATEYNLIMEPRVCTMYAIATGFDPKTWDYRQCQEMMEFAERNDQEMVIKSLVYGGPMEKHP